MLTKGEEAAARTTASEKNRLRETYQGYALESSIKLEIGELLFCMEFAVGRELSQLGWQLFERLLRQYMDLKHTGASI